MTRTVDVVIVGGGAAAMADAIGAARRGLKVLVVVRSRSGNLAQRLRQRFRRALEVSQPRVIVLTGAEVACVDGVHSIEAVVVRYLRSRRLVGFNASAVLPKRRCKPPTYCGGAVTLDAGLVPFRIQR
jgi:2-polyprenyl-6-methoxyphenol hydroxylase-like FAD-dependent oxidoreductase